MGPKNRALVRLFRADQALRAAQERLASATKNVRLQDRRVRDLDEKLKLAQSRLREQQTQSAQLDLDLKSRDERIERLRAQQQEAKNNKEYQAFLMRINTEKVDRNKVEEQAMKLLESVETELGSTRELQSHLEGEQARLATMKAEIGDTTVRLEGEVQSLRPEREEALNQTPLDAARAFERLSERFDGDALAPITRLGKRREEYVCGHCNMELVTDVYNRLYTQDELVFCPSCQRVLFIPEDMTPDVAIYKQKEKKASSTRSRSGAAVGSGAPAAVSRQSSAIDVLKSIQVEADVPEGEKPAD